MTVTGKLVRESGGTRSLAMNPPSKPSELTLSHSPSHPPSKSRELTLSCSPATMMCASVAPHALVTVFDFYDS